MDDLEGDQLVVGGSAAGDEEEGGIATVDDFGVYSLLDRSLGTAGGMRGFMPLYSRKLHMRVRRDRTSWVTSLTTLAFSLGDSVVNHLARRWDWGQSASLTGAGWATNHFALSGQEDQVAGRVSCVDNTTENVSLT